MAPTNKSLKEDFVSNLSGGDISEINLVTAVAPVSVFLWSALQARQNLFEHYGPVPFLADFLLNVGAILLATTLYSSSSLLLNTLLLLPALGLYVLPPAKSTKKRQLKPSRTAEWKSAEASRNDLDNFPIRPFVTAYRGTMMVVTCVAILAVDFRVFPRRFAKVETWGTSLMDIGVGSFVFSSGLVSARSGLKDQVASRSSSLGRRFYASSRHSLPLLVLGLVRLYSVKGLDYAEHVTEYGVHWNFFFTLGFLAPFMALFQSLFALIPSYALLSISLSATYELLLNFTDLKAYIITAPRGDLLSKNREGVFSFIGYLAIFLAGYATGQYVIPRRPFGAKGGASATSQRKTLLIRLICWSIVWSTLLFLTVSYKYGFGLQVSRRLANLPYVLWVSAFSSAQLTCFCVVETLAFPGVYRAEDTRTENSEGKRATSRILHAYNRNGLAIFLLANLLTGLVNLTIDTLIASKMKAVAILLVYAAIVTSVAISLDTWDLSIKL